jgi:ribose/xylose/arabinose/galactoside ABC-type transport system permease subunit
MFRSATVARRYGIVGVLLLECALWTVLTPYFFTQSNLTNILNQASLTGVVAVGMTFVIITAGIDLSVGSLVGFAGIVSVDVATRTGSGPLALLVAIGVGLASGGLVGFMIARLKVAPFITTLAMLSILNSATLLWKDGSPIVVHSNLIRDLGGSYVGAIPIAVLIMIAIYIIAHWVLTNTSFGRHVYAIGGNPRAANSVGIRVDRHLIAVYVLTGGLAGLGAVLIAGRLGTATPLTGTGLELDVIAAVIVGGTSLFGGVGTLWGTLTGVLIIACLRNGLTLMNVSGFWQPFATGVALLVAVLIDRRVHDRQ